MGLLETQGTKSMVAKWSGWMRENKVPFTIVESIHGCMGPTAAQGVGLRGGAVADSESRRKLGAKA